MIEQNTQKRYQSACQQASNSLLRHPQLSMAEQLHSLAAEVAADEQRDVYGSGQLIESFEHQVAQLLGKEAALFLPTGTLAQPLALKVHSQQTGNIGVALHPTSHLLLHEQMGIEHLWGLSPQRVGQPRQPVELQDLNSLHSSQLAALLIELPMREIGGQLPDWESLVEQTDWARKNGVRSHLDGARLWQTPTFYQRGLAEICALFDSVYVSFYKDLAGISGAVLAADADFIQQAKVWARRAGGNLISLYPELLAARKGLRENLPVMPDAVHYARALGCALAEIDAIEVTPNPPQAAMFHLTFTLSRQDLAEKISLYVQEQGVVILPLPRSGDENHSVCEITIGRNAMAQPQSFWLRHMKQFIATL
ncbi:MAG: threonine aldolase family protein [Pseudomonadota bacterium]